MALAGAGMVLLIAGLAWASGRLQIGLVGAGAGLVIEAVWLLATGRFLGRRLGPTD